MVVNWPEIGVELALIVLLLAMVGVYVRYRVLPKLKSDAGMWVGAAIGRFMQSLAEDAAAEGGEGGVVPAGALSIGGFKIDVGTVREIVAVLPEIVKAIQMLKGIGLLGGGGGGGENPFLK